MRAFIIFKSDKSDVSDEATECSIVVRDREVVSSRQASPEFQPSESPHADVEDVEPTARDIYPSCRGFKLRSFMWVPMLGFRNKRVNWGCEGRLSPQNDTCFDT